MAKRTNLLVTLTALASIASTTFARNSLARTPPMGWMSWELFRCDVDCSTDPTSCISEKMYMGQTDALAENGYLEAGYTGIHMDDCWESKHPPRDPTTHKLAPNSTRFPSGLKALGDYMHGKGATFGLYTAESPTTCGGYPASANMEVLDAQTFAEWGVDYMKVDGCGSVNYYKGGYKAMGAALEASGRDIVYSCSWPAYINGGNESKQPFAEFINDGCNLWRNFYDIQCNWNSLSVIIEHWGEYGESLVPYAGPGHWHDMDMLLIGANCITEDEEKTQMAIWSISAAPLIMGNDLRNVSDESKSILLNKDAIAVNQDSLGQMGMRISNGNTPTQIWARNLGNGDVAVALYNSGGAKPILPPFRNDSKLCSPKNEPWTKTTGGYYEACGGAGGDLGQFSNLTVDEAKQKCCSNSMCAGFDYNNGNGFWKSNANCGITKAKNYVGYTRSSAIPSPVTSASDITVQFNDPNINLFGNIDVYDIWEGKSLGTFTNNYTAKNIKSHATAFLRLSKSK
jgi:alpha-N-acetylgalactosaminidase